MHRWNSSWVTLHCVDCAAACWAAGPLTVKPPPAQDKNFAQRGATTHALACRAGVPLRTLTLCPRRRIALVPRDLCRAMSGGPLADDAPEAGYDYDLIVIGGGSGGTQPRPNAVRSCDVRLVLHRARSP